MKCSITILFLFIGINTMAQYDTSVSVEPMRYTSSSGSTWVTVDSVFKPIWVRAILTYCDTTRLRQDQRGRDFELGRLGWVYLDGASAPKFYYYNKQPLPTRYYVTVWSPTKEK